LLGALLGCGARTAVLDTETETVPTDASAPHDASPPAANDATAPESAAPDVEDVSVAEASPSPDVAPPPPGCPTRVRVFVTSSTVSGDLGGVMGADALCLKSARSQGIGDMWTAWLSDSIRPASTRVVATSGGYVLLDGTVVAHDFQTLVSGRLDHAIDRTEANVPVTDGNTEVWTGYDVTGGMTSPGFCSSASGGDWSSTDHGAPTPLVGHLDAVDPMWSAAYLQFCDRTNVRLYCFETCF
jgi:hypothetical protein